MPDRGETFQSEDNPDVALSYGSLIYKQQRPFCNKGLGSEKTLSTSGHWTQMSHTARQTATLPDKRTAHWGHVGQSNKGSQEHLLQQSLQQRKHETHAVDYRPSLGMGYSTLRVPQGPSRHTGGFQSCPVPPPQAKPPGPTRVDMPPDEDWRQNSYIIQPGVRRMLPGRLMDGTYSSASEAHRKMLVRAAAASMHNSDW